ncbi:MAG: hypothetical protein CMG46_00255 [Candidatus Marinimicrobia bacterium]|nr:hypothetical protein [Candidatus Neomarinimicrobiota bacterium]
MYLHLKYHHFIQRIWYTLFKNLLCNNSMIYYLYVLCYIFINIISVYPLDILIIGAGQSGIVTTHYLSQNKENNIWTVEKYGTLGGTWRLGNHYPNLVANNARDTFTLPDLPSLPGSDDFPTLNTTFTYLNRYVDTFNLHKYIYYNTTVTKVSQINSLNSTFGYKYKVDFEYNTHSLPKIYDSIVFATGYTHLPNIPYIQGSEIFNGKIIHSSNVTTELDNIANKDVVILGGGKSSLDVAIWASKNNAKTVHIVLRNMHWGIPRYIGGNNPYDGEWNQNIIYSRLSQMFLPTCLSCYNDISNIPLSTWLLHNTTIGIQIRDSFWNMISKQIIQQYDIPEWLVPPRTLYEDGLYLSVLHPEIYSLIKNDKIKIHTCRYISKIYKYELHIDNISGCIAPKGAPISDPIIKSDIIIMGTGFKSSIQSIISNTIYKNLFNRYGQIQLFRAAYNPNLPGVGFVGFKHNSNTMLSAALAARWVSEYLKDTFGRISMNGVLTDKEEIWRQIHNGNQFEREFSKIHGNKETSYSNGRGGLYQGNSIYPYADSILTDLGIHCYRYNNWISEYTEPQVNILYSGMDSIIYNNN